MQTRIYRIFRINRIVMPCSILRFAGMTVQVKFSDYRS